MKSGTELVGTDLKMPGFGPRPTSHGTEIIVTNHQSEDTFLLGYPKIFTLASDGYEEVALFSSLQLKLRSDPLSM